MPVEELEDVEIKVVENIVGVAGACRASILLNCD